MQRLLSIVCLVAACFSHEAFAAEPIPADTDTDSLAQFIVNSAGARGGLCIHVECGDGALTAGLAQTGRYLVHGLSTDAREVQFARRYIESLKLYGVASVDHSRITKLPYADDLANLMVVDDLPRVLKAGGSLSEIMRVLAPLGVAMVGTRADAAKPLTKDDLQNVLRQNSIERFELIESNGLWARIVKPRPREMDQWTHAQHGPDRNPVARDTLVEPPNNVRWMYGPLWRGSSGVQLSANGRNIYTDGTVRDAFNGLRVCTLRDLGKYKYVTPLLAVGDWIYLVAPRASQFLQAADATTGKIVMTFEHIKNPVSLAYVRGNLYFTGSEGTGCVVAETGALQWLHEDAKVAGPTPRGTSALVVTRRYVFVQTPASKRSETPSRLVCLGRQSGRLLWQKATPELQGELLLHSDDVVICCDSYRVYPKHVYAYAVDDGRFLWKSHAMNEGKSVGVYAIDGLIWCQHNRQTVGLDVATGEVKRKFEGTPGTFKCAAPAATTRFMMGGNLGFLDLSRGTTQVCRLDRNGCGMNPGVLFCNGLTYSFPKQCSCFSMMRGYTAFASDKPLSEELSPQLVVGSAQSERLAAVEPASSDWPTFRHDTQRSAHTSSSVLLPLEKLWESNCENQTAPDSLRDDWRNHPALGGPVSSVVAAGGLLCASLSDSHRVVALDSATGQIRWTFTAGGRVASPPTISDGRCYFGGQDGWVYCVRLDDASLLWKFRAAPIDRRVLVCGQLESLWPVTGGVLVQDGRAYFTAGRMSNLIGGLVGYAVDARTGELIWKQQPPTEANAPAKDKIAAAYRNDIPVSGQGVVQLGHPRWIVREDSGDFAADQVPVQNKYVKPISVPILGSTRDGLTDLSRSRWQGPTDMGHGYLAQEFADLWAQQLVIRDDRIFGFQLPTIQTRYYDNEQRQVQNTLRLIAWTRAGNELWSKPLPAGTELVAMIGAGDTLFATGTERQEERPYYKGWLWAFSATDGTDIARVELDGLPAGEGLSAAYGKLYVTMQEGRVICLGKR